MKIHIKPFIANPNCRESVEVDGMQIEYASSHLDWRVIDENTISVNGRFLFFPPTIAEYDVSMLHGIVYKAGRDVDGTLAVEIGYPIISSGKFPKVTDFVIESGPIIPPEEVVDDTWR